MSTEIRDLDRLEVDAIAAINRHLAALDRDACTRIVDWARARFVDEKPINITRVGPVIETFVSAFEQAAKKLDTTPRDVMDAILRVADSAPETPEEGGAA